MTTLRDFVNLRDALSDALVNLSLDQAVSAKLKILNAVGLQHILYKEDLQAHVNAYQSLITENNKIVESIKDTISKINRDLNQHGSQLDQSNFNGSTMLNYLSTNSDLETILLSRMTHYSQWKYPGLQLNCRYPSIDQHTPKIRINSMVTADPLYLAGPDIDSLKDSISSYPDAYQNRVRLYEIHNTDWSILPQAQFGFIFCWDFFNYLPLNTVELHLTNILKLLKPGGILMFSYTNGELAETASAIDNNTAAWASNTLIKDLVTKVGYEIVILEDFLVKGDYSSWISWAEVRRLGELTTVKLAQAKGLIGQK
jgi:hypothetical protein